MARVIDYADLPAAVGAVLAPSPWQVIDQSRIDRFAEATEDRQWIHVDVARASREIGGTIAHGFLTLSMLPVLWAETLEISGVSRQINYGFDKLRFTGVVRSGDRVRLALTLTGVEDKAGGRLVTCDCRVEIEGGERPALIGGWLVLLFP